MHRAGTAGSPYIGPHRGDLLSNLVPFSRGAGQSPMDPLEDGFGMVLIPASSVTSTVSRLGRDDIGFGGPFEAPHVIKAVRSIGRAPDTPAAPRRRPA